MTSQPQACDLLKWRRAIRHPRGPGKSTTRHVLLTLATWGSSSGEAMFPTIETLAVATGLHRETVRRALDEAERGGWVQRSPRRHITGDRITDARISRWSYSACIPDDALLVDDVEHPWERDPKWVSERGHRPRRKQGHVPAQDRDNKSANSHGVPVVRENVPAQDGHVPAQRGHVPAQDSISSPLHDLLNTSSLRDALTRTGSESTTMNEQQQEAEPEPEARQPALRPVATRRLASAGGFARGAEPLPERLRKAAKAATELGLDIEKVASMYVLTREQVIDAISNQREQEA